MLCVVCGAQPGAERRDQKCWRCRGMRLALQCSCGNASRKNSNTCRSCQRRDDRAEKREARCKDRYVRIASAKLRRHINEIRAAPPHVRANMECVNDFITRHETAVVYEGKHQCRVEIGDELEHESCLSPRMTCGTQFACGDYCGVCDAKIARLPETQRWYYFNREMGPFKE